MTNYLNKSIKSAMNFPLFKVINQVKMKAFLINLIKLFKKCPNCLYSLIITCNIIFDFCLHVI